MKQVWVLRNLVIFAGKKLFLKIKTGSPGQVAADFQVLTLAMTVHILRQHPLSRLSVVGATCRVNVVIPRPPSKLRWVYPPLELKSGALAWTFYLNDARLLHVLRTSCELNFVFAL